MFTIHCLSHHALQQVLSRPVNMPSLYENLWCLCLIAAFDPNPVQEETACKNWICIPFGIFTPIKDLNHRPSEATALPPELEAAPFYHSTDLLYTPGQYLSRCCCLNIPPLLHPQIFECFCFAPVINMPTCCVGDCPETISGQSHSEFGFRSQQDYNKCLPICSCYIDTHWFWQTALSITSM